MRLRVPAVTAVTRFAIGSSLPEHSAAALHQLAPQSLWCVGREWSHQFAVPTASVCQLRWGVGGRVRNRLRGNAETVGPR